MSQQFKEPIILNNFDETEKESGLLTNGVKLTSKERSKARKLVDKLIKEKAYLSDVVSTVISIISQQIALYEEGLIDRVDIKTIPDFEEMISSHNNYQIIAERTVANQKPELLNEYNALVEEFNKAVKNSKIRILTLKATHNKFVDLAKKSFSPDVADAFFKFSE